MYNIIFNIKRLNFMQNNILICNKTQKYNKTKNKTNIMKTNNKKNTNILAI